MTFETQKHEGVKTPVLHLTLGYTGPDSVFCDTEAKEWTLPSVAEGPPNRFTLQTSVTDRVSCVSHW